MNYSCCMTGKVFENIESIFIISSPFESQIMASKVGRGSEVEVSKGAIWISFHRCTSSLNSFLIIILPSFANYGLQDGTRRGSKVKVLIVIIFVYHYFVDWNITEFIFNISINLIIVLQVTGQNLKFPPYFVHIKNEEGMIRGASRNLIGDCSRTNASSFICCIFCILTIFLCLISSDSSILCLSSFPSIPNAIICKVGSNQHSKWIQWFPGDLVQFIIL